MGYWNNDNSFWDWYRIGGRWDGILTDNVQDVQESENGFNLMTNTKRQRTIH